MEKKNESNGIMIVDDDESLGGTLLYVLQKAGYQAQWVQNAKEALQQLTAIPKDHRPDTVFVDIRLPDMNGLDLLREGRKVNPDLAAIVMTGYADTQTAVRAVNEGAFAYLLKPYNIDEVKLILARLMERRHLLKQNRDLVQQLQDANAELERKVAERTEALQSANADLAATIKKLRDSDAAKTSFVSMVSHELRTPLTVIEGFTETLMDKLEGLSKDEIMRYLDIINGETLRLTRLIQNILDLSAMEAKGVSIHPVNIKLKALIESVTQGLEMIKTGVHFDVSFPTGEIEIMSDKDCIQQILVNLLSNAVKYSTGRGAVRIEGADLGSAARISVIDSGPGIPEEEREKIFRAFYRGADAVSRKTPGTGLGLTITRAIVEALGGRIWVESGPGRKGANFSFELPKKVAGDKTNGQIYDVKHRVLEQGSHERS